MKALLYKRKHIFASWMLEWEVNGLKYVDTFRIKKEAIEYAQAIGATVETINEMVAQGGGKTAQKVKKYDNCKNCEHAGKDREFVCPMGSLAR